MMVGWQATILLIWDNVGYYLLTDGIGCGKVGGEVIRIEES